MAFDAFSLLTTISLLELRFETELFYSVVGLKLISCQLIYTNVFRNLYKWKQWRQQRQFQRQRQAVNGDADSLITDNDEIEDVPDGQLCVICLMRRRRSVFIPCGHLVCCQGCALSVEREVTPKCPVCRQEIRNSVRIFES